MLKLYLKWPVCLDGDHDGDGVGLEAVPVHTDVLHQGVRLQLGLNLT